MDAVMLTPPCGKRRPWLPLVLLAMTGLTVLGAVSHEFGRALGSGDTRSDREPALTAAPAGQDQTPARTPEQPPLPMMSTIAEAIKPTPVLPSTTDCSTQKDRSPGEGVEPPDPPPRHL